MLEPTFIIYSAILGLVLIVIFRRPSVAFGAFLCTYGLEQWAQSRSGFFYTHGSLTNFVTAGVLVWALLIRQFKGLPVLTRPTPVFWIAIALFLFSLMSIGWSVGGPDAVAQWKKNAPYLIAVILLLPLVVGDFDDLRAAFLMALAMGSLLLLLLFFDSGWEGRQIQLRQGAAIGSIKSDRGNPLAVASLAGWLSLIALLMNPRGLGRIWVLGRWPLVMLGLIIAFKSGSRGQLFAMVAAGLMFLPMSRRIRNIGGFLAVVFGTGIFLVLATWAFDTFTADTGKRWDAENMISTWSTSRLDTTMALLNYWLDAGPVAWLIGIGTSGSFRPDIVGFYPHMVMGEVLGELGLIGFALLWLFVLVALHTIWKLYTAIADDPERRGLLAALAAMFMFEVILSFKQGSLLGNPYAFGFAITAANLWRVTRTQANPGLLAPYGNMPPVLQADGSYARPSYYG